MLVDEEDAWIEALRGVYRAVRLLTKIGSREYGFSKKSFDTFRILLPSSEARHIVHIYYMIIRKTEALTLVIICISTFNNSILLFCSDMAESTFIKLYTPNEQQHRKFRWSREFDSRVPRQD